MKTYKLNRDWTMFSEGELFKKADDDCVLCTLVGNEDILARIPDKYLDEQIHAWRPNEDGAYHYIDSDGIVLNEEYYIENDHTDKGRLAIGNCFKTAQEANDMRDWLKARQRLIESGARFVNALDVDSDEVKYFEVYLDGYSTLQVSECYLRKNVVVEKSLCFSNRELAKQSIKEHKDDWLTYLGVKKDGDGNS